MKYIILKLLFLFSIFSIVEVPSDAYWLLLLMLLIAYGLTEYVHGRVDEKSLWRQPHYKDMPAASTSVRKYRSKDVEILLERLGFNFESTKGSHRRYEDALGNRVSVDTTKKEISLFSAGHLASALVRIGAIKDKRDLFDSVTNPMKDTTQLEEDIATLLVAFAKHVHSQGLSSARRISRDKYQRELVNLFKKYGWEQVGA